LKKKHSKKIDKNKIIARRGGFLNFITLKLEPEGKLATNHEHYIRIYEIADTLI